MARRISDKTPIVSVSTKQGRVVNLHAGDVVTDDISDESIAHLEAIGFIVNDAPAKTARK